jgi:hypothetical protein
MGRVSQVSNPYRVASAGATGTASWATTSYNALGLVISVMTPDNAQVTTSYEASTSDTLATTVTVTDQAGKQRRSLSDLEDYPR